MKHRLISLLLILIVVFVSVPPTLSYFFTYVETSGTVTVRLSDGGSINEDVPPEEPIKNVTITADENSDPIFVRVKVFAADDVEITTLSEGWTKVDGYFEYAEPIDGFDSDSKFARSTKTLKLEISIPKSEKEEDAIEKHVVVVFEATPAIYENGSWTKNWDVKIEPNASAEEGGENNG